jgi:hypothetical protein
MRRRTAGSVERSRPNFRSPQNGIPGGRTRGSHLNAEVVLIHLPVESSSPGL